MYNKNLEKKALFLDRDGVINEDFGYVSKIENFKFKDDIFSSLREFVTLKYLLIIVTNQSGIGRGYYSKDDFLNLTEFMLREFNKNGIVIDKVYFCPHSPETDCECRKPKPGMLLQAKNEFGLNLEKSIMIGDKKSDIEAGVSAGVKHCFLIDGINLKSVKDVLEIVKERDEFKK